MTTRTEARRADDPANYDWHGMKPQCSFIVHFHSCRLDAGHDGLHSPGRAAPPATAGAPDRCLVLVRRSTYDVACGYPLPCPTHTERAAGADPLDVDRLALAMANVQAGDGSWMDRAIKERGNWEWSDYAKEYAAEYARLGAATPREEPNDG